MQKPRYLVATAKHEKYYASVTAAAIQHGMQDREVAALLGMILGRMVAGAKPGADRDTIRDTAIFNMKQAIDDWPNVAEALRTGPH